MLAAQLLLQVHQLQTNHIQLQNFLSARISITELLDRPSLQNFPSDLAVFTVKQLWL